MAKKIYFLIGLFACSLIIIIGLSWSTLSRLSNMHEAAATRAEDSLQTTDGSYIGQALYEIVADSIINGNLEESAKLWQEIKAKTEKQMKEVEHNATTDQERSLAKSARQAYDSFIVIYEKEMLPVLHSDPKNLAVISPIDDKLDQQKKIISEKLIKIQIDIQLESKTANAEFHSVARNSILVLLMVGTGILVAALLFGLGITRKVLGQLGGDPLQVAQVVNTMATGDFSHSPTSVAAGSLLESAFHMQRSLRGMISTVKEQANQVEDMANSLAAAAKQIAGNVNNESNSVSTMAATIEEMSVSTSHISSQGGNARNIADASRSSTEAGAKVVNKTVSGLLQTAQEIETASGEVSRLGENATRIIDVVKVIKDIADQTNLLALNAAIEAARAGEQGRGFAVVADEVRKLAERTGNATSEINLMSEKISEVVRHTLDSMGKVVETTRQGVADAETAQSSIATIQQNFGEVANVIDDISAALAEQTVASNELAKNTELVAHMSEQNSGAANNLLSLAHELQSKAHQVKGAVAVFKI